ncbi:hypothetical protein HRI_002332000 [Hibiscus trionum]|uniref:Endonuclease/exonuclease/phosphatase domain-containing protein n=1 Tax=Hibiscus trionum TaxID=183268 RepID=A0A9W7M214_HIBTR|nr:hypothetical protein HRI_002332000 [Hibiscus trionum]
MRVLSWNIRGLGSLSKKKVVKSLLRQHNCDMMFLQKSKLEVVNDSVIHAVWHSNNYEFLFSLSQGRPGGILVIWEGSRLC